MYSIAAKYSAWLGPHQSVNGAHVTGLLSTPNSISGALDGCVACQVLKLPSSLLNRVPIMCSHFSESTCFMAFISEIPQSNAIFLLIRYFPKSTFI